MPLRKRKGGGKEAGTRLKPLRVTLGIVAPAVYPSIVRSLYNKNPAMAIMMWAAVSAPEGALLSAGSLEKMLNKGHQKKSVVISASACACFLREMARIQLLNVNFEDTTPRSDSALYTVAPNLCLEADPPEGEKPHMYEIDSVDVLVKFVDLHDSFRIRHGGVQHLKRRRVVRL